MDAKVGDFPDRQYAVEVCKLGQGHGTCRYLTMGRNGWSCEKHGELRATIDFKVRMGMFTARGDNCPGKDAR
jgi:hypothetical protein